MFSIVIPTVGRTSLEELLRSIPSGPLLVSVIVVGDASISAEMAETIATKLRSWSRFEIKWVRAKTPGVNAARNAGIQEASADARTKILLFLDDDVVLAEDFDWGPIRDLYTDSSVLAVGGGYLSSSNLDFSGRGYNLMCSGWRVASGFENNEALLGGVWSIRVPELLHVCRDLGWFEEAIQYGGAETPFVHRLRGWAAGSWKIIYSPRLDVFHYPRNRRLKDWLRIASLQNERLDGVTKAARPAAIARLRRLSGFCLSLPMGDLVAFLGFTIPFVAAGRLSSLFSNAQKSK